MSRLERVQTQLWRYLAIVVWACFLACAQNVHGSGFMSMSNYPATPLMGPVYYVAPYGNDGHSKAQAANRNTAWRTLQKAADNAVAGDTFVVLDGTYTASSGNWVVLFNKSGTASNPIRFVSENRWGAVIDGQYSRREAVQFAAVHHVILEGFDIQRGASGGISANFGHSSGSLEFGPDGVRGSAHITIRGNWIHDNGNHRASTGGCDSSDTFYGRVGIGTGTHQRYWTVEGNIIHNNGRLEGGCDYSQQGRSAHDYIHDHGWYAQGVGHIARNNIFFGHQAGLDIKLDGSVHPTPAGVRTHTVINNTFANYRPYSDGQVGLYRNATAGGQSQNVPKDVLIMNNVFWNPNGHTGDGVAISLHLGGWGNAGDSNQYWRGTEIVGNITTGDHIIPSAHAYKFNNSGMTLEGNVTNRTHSGLKGTTLGMVAPKSGQWKPLSNTTRVDAKETDFMPTSTATRLLDAGRASFTDRHGRGLPVVAAPVRDYLNAPRPQGTGPDLGSFESTRRGNNLPPHPS